MNESNHEKKMVEIESFIFDSGDFVQIIPSGFKGAKLLVFEDVAYNIHVEYLDDELYQKLLGNPRIKHHRKVRIEDDPLWSNSFC